MTITKHGFYHANDLNDLYLNGIFNSQISEVDALRNSTFVCWDVRWLTTTGADLTTLKAALTIAISIGMEVRLLIGFTGLTTIDSPTEQNNLYNNLAILNALGLLAPVTHFIIDEPNPADMVTVSMPGADKVDAIYTTLLGLYPSIKRAINLKGYDLASYTSTMLANANINSVSIDFYTTIPALFYYNPVTFASQYKGHFEELLRLANHGEELALIYQTAVIDVDIGTPGYPDGDVDPVVLQMIALNDVIKGVAQHPRVNAIISFLYSEISVADIVYAYENLSNRSHAHYSETLRKQIEETGRPLITEGGFAHNFLGMLFLGGEVPTPTGLGNKYRVTSYFKTQFRPVSSYQDVQV